ncbi:hypothetical protein D3C78_853780 [compost metagenome]
MAEIRADIELLAFQIKARVRQDRDAVFFRQIALALHRIAIVNLEAQAVAGHQQCSGDIKLEARHIAVCRTQWHGAKRLTVEHQLHSGVARCHCRRDFQVQRELRVRDDLIDRESEVHPAL